MKEFTLVERTEPFTFKEVIDFIDDTNISKMDAHELKCRIVDVIQTERNEAIEEFADWCYMNGIDFSYMMKATDTENFCERVIKRFNEEQLKGGSDDE